ncbi:MAG: primosomal protein N' [Planctomycetes bacterium]|nr:primosomal protein N' [Planctomycetota bacterium]
MFAQIVVPVPLDHPFTYEIPPGLVVPVGSRVVVPFGTRTLVGACVGHTDQPPKARAKPVLRVLDPEPAFGPALLELARWVATYYFSSWGEALMAALPAPVRRTGARAFENVAALAVTAEEARGKAAELREVNSKWSQVLEVLVEAAQPVAVNELVERLSISDSPVRTLERRGLVRVERRLVDAGDPLLAHPPSDAPVPEATPEQDAAVAAIVAAAGTFRAFLLYGVTGSGKTEVYLRAIAQAIAAGRRALVLVPEIALTPQTISRFAARFKRLAVMHHRLTDAQRSEQWRRIKAGEADVVIGARSAVFAPVPDLGLIVVDEEHEPSYKAGNEPRYHARDVAVKRAQLERATVVLGSATPSLETWRNAQEGKYAMLRLPERVTGRPLPPVELIDMSAERGLKGMPLLLSKKLDAAVRDATAKDEQVILFLNRRGFATLVVCPGCKYVLRCEHCDVAMTFHKRRNVVVCHHCHAEGAPPVICPACRVPGLKYVGLGTERVEEEIKAAFADATVARLDRDTTRARGSHARILTAVADGTTDILIGTQMVAKGHDVPNVTLVGVVNADSALYINDFRAGERTFQLVAQVAGRAGRGTSAGRVLVQTMSPDAAPLALAAKHDFETFAAQEMAFRREWIWPPFVRLLRLVVSAPTPDEAQGACAACVEIGKAALGNEASLVLGPEAAPIPFLRDKHRWHAMFRSKSWEVLWKVVNGCGKVKAERKKAEFSWDMDAMEML